MTSSNHNEPTPSTPALRSLCSLHLQHEATLLTAALSLLRSLETVLRQRNGSDLSATVSQQVTLAGQIAELNRRRAQFRAAAASLVSFAPESITVASALGQLPAAERGALPGELTRVRAMAVELAALIRRVSIFLRIHLHAYQRILRDLTNSRRSSGAYGPTGNRESLEFRPLLQIHG